MSAERLRALDGLRGLLALYILAGHTVPFLWLPAGAGWMRSAFSHGLAAVEIFFVLSGLVILRSLDGRRGTAAFLIARAGRLLPVYAIALGLAAVVLAAGDPMPAMPWLPGAGMARDLCEDVWPHSWTGHLVAHLTMTQGLLPAALLPDAEFSILGPAWSLSTEWQFYAVVAAILAVGVPRARPLVVGLLLLAMVADGLALLPTEWRFGRAFLPHQAGYFALGIASYGLLADGGGRAAWGFYVRVLAVLSLLCVGEGGIGKLAVPLVWTLCLLGEVSALSWSVFLWRVVAGPARRVRQILTLPLLLWFGAISYPLYLIHAPVQRALMLMLAPQTADWRMFSMIWGPPALLLPVLVGYGLHRWVEVPCWQWSSRLSGSRSTVTRGLDPRAYPRRRPNAILAPERVGSRIKSTNDELTNDG